MRYIGQRLVQLIAVLLIVTFLTFLLVRFLPGDPVLSVTGCPATATEDPICADKIAQATEDLGLDEPIPVAYLDWLGDLLPPDVDLGFSYVRNTEVSELFSTAIPRTATLMVYSIIVSLVIAIPLGVIAAYRQSRWTDRFISTGAFGMIAIPNFVMAVVLIYIFAIQLGWLPASGVVEHQRGRARRARQELHPAGPRPRPAAGRRVHAAAPHRHGGDAVGGLHRHGQGQGDAGTAHPAPPRPAAVELHAADRRRHQHRPADRGCGHHRVHLQHQRHGLPAGHRRRPARTTSSSRPAS